MIVADDPLTEEWERDLADLFQEEGDQGPGDWLAELDLLRPGETSAQP